MGQLNSISFGKNLRRFLGPSRLSGAADRIAGISKSLSADPVEPIDAVFSSLSDRYDSPDHLAGFQAVTRQLLANDVLESLIQMQSDMLNFDDTLTLEHDSLNAKAAYAYQRGQESFPAENFSTIVFGS